jgi:iron-sulfur cluster repair protein YtfE (RIC family)
VAEVGRRVHRGHGDQPQSLVGIGQSLELLGQHLAEDLIDPQ